MNNPRFFSPKSLIVTALIMLCFYQSKGQISFAPLDTLDYFGTFHEPTYLHLDVVDFDKDGNKDLIYLLERELILKKGIGNGFFSNPSVLFKDGNNTILEATKLIDINKDGFFDIALRRQHDIIVLFGDGSNLNIQNTISLDNSIWYSNLILIDIDANGLLELAIISNHKSICINYDWRDDSSNFQTIHQANNPISTVLFEHMSEDEHTDIITGGADGLSIMIYQSQNQYTKTIIDPLWIFGDFMALDINLDGRKEIIYNRNLEDIFVAIQNSQDEPYTVNNLTSSDEMVHNPGAFAFNDTDNNGTLDLLFFSQQGRILLKPNFNGLFQPAQIILEDLLVERNFIFSDLDNDNIDDIIATGFSGIEVYLLDKNLNSIEAIYDYKSPSSKDLIQSDIDKDGYTDILSVNANGRLFLHWGGNTEISEPTEINILNYAQAATIIDVDNDQINDIVFSRVTNTWNSELRIVYGEGDRSFGKDQAWKYSGSSLEIMTLDLDHDAIEDVVVLNWSKNEIVWFNGINSDYDEYFQSEHKISFSGSGRLTHMDINDLNGDGLMDIMTLDRDNNRLIAFYQTTPGIFEEVYVEIDKHIVGFSTGDINADNYMDLYLTDQTQQSTWIYTLLIKLSKVRVHDTF